VCDDAAGAAACGPGHGGDDVSMLHDGCRIRVPHAALALVAAAALLAGCASAPPTASAADAAILATLLARYDVDRDGAVQQREHPRGAAAFANLDRNRDGAIDAADFRLPAPDPMDVLRRQRTDPAQLPKVGDLAPDFALPMLGMPGTTVRLSSLRGDRPVALVFGSMT
jgi:hypothetical protein